LVFKYKRSKINYMYKYQKGFSNLTLILLVVVVLGIGGYAALNQKASVPEPIPGPGEIGCTLDAKQCPDGSYVGRTGPNCEFSECPGIPTPPPKPGDNPGPVACTMDAKQCPDGSYVGRTGPKCEFAECPSTNPKQGSVSGVVTVSPACPGPEKYPPDPNCAPKPYATPIDIMKSGTTGIIKTTSSNTNGVFNMSLEAGSYTFYARSGSALPRCEGVTAVVKSGQNTTINIECDSGMR
jgi:hypothetical protein